MAGEVRVLLVAVAALVTVATAPAAAIDPVDPTEGSIGPLSAEEPTDPARETWNQAMVAVAEALAPVARTVDPVIITAEEATGADTCTIQGVHWQVLPEGWRNPTFWCPGGDPGEDGQSAPGASERLGSSGAAAPMRERSLGARSIDTLPASKRSLSVAETAPPVAGPDPGHAVVLAGLVAATAAALWLYRRLTRSTLEENPHRERMLAILREEPGRTCRELADRLDVAYGTVRYHLRLLEEFDHVSGRRFGRHVRYYVNGNGEDATDKRVAAAMSVATKREILELLDDQGPTCSGELAEAVGVARSTCSEHLKDLSEADLLERRCDGRRRLYDIEDDVRASLGRLT